MTIRVAQLVSTDPGVEVLEEMEVCEAGPDGACEDEGKHSDTVYRLTAPDVGLVYYVCRGHIEKDEFLKILGEY